VGLRIQVENEKGRGLGLERPLEAILETLLGMEVARLEDIRQGKGLELPLGLEQEGCTLHNCR